MTSPRLQGGVKRAFLPPPWQSTLIFCLEVRIGIPDIFKKIFENFFGIFQKNFFSILKKFFSSIFHFSQKIFLKNYQKIKNKFFWSKIWKNFFFFNFFVRMSWGTPKTIFRHSRVLESRNSQGNKNFNDFKRMLQILCLFT